MVLCSLEEFASLVTRARIRNFAELFRLEIVNIERFLMF